MHQEFARAGFRMTELACGCVGADVDAIKKGLATADASVAVAQIHAMVPQGLHLGSDQRESRFDGFLDEEVVTSFAIVRDEVVAVLVALGLCLLSRHSRLILSCRTMGL
jgi:hypothetical protein